MGDSSSNTGGEDGVEAPEVSSPVSAVLPQEARKSRHEIVKCSRTILCPRELGIGFVGDSTETAGHTWS